MLQRALARVARHARRQTPARYIATTRVLWSGQTTIAAMLLSHPDANVATVDHLMTAERAAQLMAEMHLDALPVVKNDKVVGVFTEHDYFDKVLNASHSAGRSSKVCEVATMGSELVVAYPEDTVECCLEVMTKMHLSAIPVVEHDGHVMGTVSMMELAKEMLATDHARHEQLKSKSKPAAAMFTEPSHFPENILIAGSGYHDDITAGMASPEQLQEIYEQLKHDLEVQAQASAETFSFDSAAAERFHLDPNLDEMAANAFSEASTFPEFTPSEDGLFAQTHGTAPSAEELELRAQVWEAQEEPITRAQSSLLSEMPGFSEPSDFPECPIVEEAIAARKRAT